MARTEKKFGQVSEPAANVNNELVASSVNRRNLAINITARSSAKISITTWTSSPSYQFSGLAINAKEVMSQNGSIGRYPTANNQIKALGIYPGSSSVAVLLGSSTATSTTTGATDGWVQFSTLSPDVSQEPISTNSYTGGTLPSQHLQSLVWPEVGRCEIGFANDVYSLPSSNENINFNTSNFKMFADVLGVSINNSTGTSNGPTNVIIGIDFQSTTTGWSRSLQDFTSLEPLNLRHYSLNIVSTTDTTKQCAVIKDAPIQYNALTLASTRIPLRVNIAKKTARPVTSMALASAVWPGSAWANETLGNNMAASIQSFSTMDYNQAKDVYAISHSTLSNSIGSASAYNGFAGNTAPALPASAAPAGFRINSNTSTVYSNEPARFMWGTDLFPSAPTGVLVPSPGFQKSLQVGSLKFSPDGNHLAVMYNRNYSGTGDKYSVAVIYSVDSSGNWNHTYSSGEKIKYCGANSDCMVWLPDSSGIIIISGKSLNDVERYIQFWVPMTGNIGYVHSSSVEEFGVSMYNKSPRIKSAFKVATSTASVSGSAISSILDTSPGAPVSVAFISSSTYPGRLVYLLLEKTQSPEYVPEKQIRYLDITTAAIIGSSGSSLPGYINTVAQDIELEAGKTIQISNIVLEPGESLYVESDTSGAVDVIAYGVEVS